MSMRAIVERPRSWSRGGCTMVQIFLIVVLAHVAGCQLLAAFGLTPVVWLINFPATVSVGWLAGRLAGDGAALAVTIPAGGLLYGWAAVRYRTRNAA
ncbi:MAG: hypothetical protein ACREAA_00080 [Candidatus Polarisedimenticolia bacterium]